MRMKMRMTMAMTMTMPMTMTTTMVMVMMILVKPGLREFHRAGCWRVSGAIFRSAWFGFSGFLWLGYAA